MADSPMSVSADRPAELDGGMDPEHRRILHEVPYMDESPAADLPVERGIPKHGRCPSCGAWIQVEPPEPHICSGRPVENSELLGALDELERLQREFWVAEYHPAATDTAGRLAPLVDAARSKVEELFASLQQKAAGCFQVMTAAQKLNRSLSLWLVDREAETSRLREANARLVEANRDRIAEFTAAEAEVSRLRAEIDAANEATERWREIAVGTPPAVFPDDLAALVAEISRLKADRLTKVQAQDLLYVLEKHPDDFGLLALDTFPLLRRISGSGSQ